MKKRLLGLALALGLCATSGLQAAAYTMKKLEEDAGKLLGFIETIQAGRVKGAEQDAVDAAEEAQKDFDEQVKKIHDKLTKKKNKGWNDIKRELSTEGPDTMAEKLSEHIDSAINSIIGDGTDAEKTEAAKKYHLMIKILGPLVKGLELPNSAKEAIGDADAQNAWYNVADPIMHDALNKIGGNRIKNYLKKFWPENKYAKVGVVGGTTAILATLGYAGYTTAKTQGSWAQGLWYKTLGRPLPDEKVNELALNLAGVKANFGKEVYEQQKKELSGWLSDANLQKVLQTQQTIEQSVQ